MRYYAYYISSWDTVPEDPDPLLMLSENLQDNHFLNPKPKRQGIDAQSWPKSGISKIFTIALCVRSGGGAWFWMDRDLVS